MPWCGVQEMDLSLLMGHVEDFFVMPEVAASTPLGAKDERPWPLRKCISMAW